MLIGGATQFDRAANQLLRESVAQSDPPVEFVDLSDFAPAEQLARVSALPADSVVVLGAFMNDSAGNELQQGPKGFRSALTRQSNAPVFFVSELNFGQGGVGGYMVNWRELGEELGKLGLSVLSGKMDTSASMVPTQSIHLRLDWRELQRWNISVARIPKDAVIDFRPPPIWETHKSAVIVSLVALSAQAIAIGLLLAERRRRRISANQLADRLRFETLLTEISAAFANLKDSDLEPAIEATVRKLGKFFDATYTLIWQIQQDSTIVRTHAWPTDTVAGDTALASDQFPETVKCLLRGEMVSFSSEAELAKLGDAKSFRATGIGSFLAIPLRTGEQTLGALLLLNRTSIRSHTPDLLARLRLSADILGSALARQSAAKALSESEETRQKLNAQAVHMNRVAEMGQLVASLTHELTQPLTAIRSNTQAASRMIDRPPTDLVEVQAALADILDDNDRARAVLANLRGAFRKHKISPQPINLNHVLERVVSMVRSNAYLRSMRLETALAPTPVVVQADEVSLQQVLLNLLHNGMDAMVGLPEEDCLLLIQTFKNRETGCGVLVVEDRGVGIPDSLKQKVFSPFFTTKSEGLGMGLTICQELMRALGGSIAVEDRPGGGARFRVELPLAVDIANKVATFQQTAGA